MNSGNVPLTDQALVRAVAAQFGLAGVDAVTLLGGTASPKWRIDTPQGRFVLRRRPAEFAGPAGTRFDHALLLRLASDGLPVPRPCQRSDGSTTAHCEGHVYELLAWVDGEPFGEGNPQAIAGVGAFLARFHQTLVGDVPPGKEGQLREDHPDLLTPYLADLYTRVTVPGVERQLDALAEQLQLVRDQLDAELYPSLPQGVIHGDLHPGNVRFRGPDVSAVYDFDYLSAQALARDVSDALMFFAAKRDSPLDPNDIRSLTQPFTLDLDRCGQLLRSYISRRPVADCEWQALPWLIRSRWLQMRLRGSRKVPPEQKVSYVLHRFFEVIDWLDSQSELFFQRLADAVSIVREIRERNGASHRFRIGCNTGG